MKQINPSFAITDHPQVQCAYFIPYEQISTDWVTYIVRNIALILSQRNWNNAYIYINNNVQSYIAPNPRYSVLRMLYIITPVNGYMCTQFLLNSLGSIQPKLPFKALHGYHSHVHSEFAELLPVCSTCGSWNTNSW